MTREHCTDPASDRPLTLDEHLAEVERRITELPTTRTQSFVTGWSSVSLGDVLDILRAYREEVRRDG